MIMISKTTITLYKGGFVIAMLVFSSQFCCIFTAFGIINKFLCTSCRKCKKSFICALQVDWVI